MLNIREKLMVAVVGIVLILLYVFAAIYHPAHNLDWMGLNRIASAYTLENTCVQEALTTLKWDSAPASGYLCTDTGKEDYCTYLRGQTLNDIAVEYCEQELKGNYAE